MTATPVVQFSVLLLALAGVAAAQTPPPEPPPRVEGSAQLTFLGTTGNASSQSLGTGGEFTWRPDPWVHTGKVVFAQQETEGDLSARSFAALFRSSKTLTERLSAYGQYDFLRDTFAGVEQRHILEGGLSYLALDRAPHRLRLDGGLGYLHEKGPDDHFDSATLSAAALYRYEISKTSEMTYEPRFLLTLADAGAWKFDQTAALTLAITKILALKVAHTIRYSAEPPEGFETTDTIAAVSLVAKFSRPR